MVATTLLLISCSLGFTTAQRQIPLVNNIPSGHETSRFTTAAANATQVDTLTLSSLSHTDFTTLSHPAHPAHQVRVKRTDGFCDKSVKSYAGYLDADYGTKHLFFYFFESRSKPESDDVLMWINGGPGGSSALGLFTELGPCNIDTNLTSGSNGTVYNPYGWNGNANIFFLDQPAGTGFSYDDFGRVVSSTDEAARDVYVFLTIFFETFSEFQGRPFHIAGESYGGRFIPLFASEIWDQNSRALDSGVSIINLQSIMIGNGLSDVVTMATSYYDVQCTKASLPPVTDIKTCVRMKQTALKCKRDLKIACVDNFDEMSCLAIYSFCRAEIGGHYAKQDRNPYDMSKVCKAGEDTACYKEPAYIEAFLNRKDVQFILSIDEGHGNFSLSTSQPRLAFSENLDDMHQTQLWIAELLERDIYVLIYVGTYDFLCNWIGNLAWAEALEWSGKDEFNRQELKPWNLHDKPAGRYKRSQRFTFATVEGAGHMVPFDKPIEPLAMVQRWLAHRRL